MQNVSFAVSRYGAKAPRRGTSLASDVMQRSNVFVSVVFCVYILITGKIGKFHSHFLQIHRNLKPLIIFLQIIIKSQAGTDTVPVRVYMSQGSRCSSFLPASHQEFPKASASFMCMIQKNPAESAPRASDRIPPYDPPRCSHSVAAVRSVPIVPDPVSSGPFRSFQIFATQLPSFFLIILIRHILCHLIDEF